MELKRAVVLASSMMFGVAHITMAQTPYRLSETEGQEKSPKPSDKTRVTMAFDNISIRDIVFAIANQGGYSVVFDDHDQALKTVLGTRVRIQFDNLSVQDALTRAMQGTGYSAKLAGGDRGIVLARDVQPSETKERKNKGDIVGQVFDSAQKQLEGVAVSVIGTKLSTTTGSHGEFRIPNTLEGNQTIEFKLVGYKSQTKAVTLTNGSTSPLRITMMPMATMLSGIVTTATGRQNRREIGSAVTSLNVDSIMKIAPVRTVTDLLEARVPGLTVQRSSGQPGDPSRLRLRGASSISGSNDPVVYVDGVRMYTDASMNQSLAQESGSSRSYSAPSGIDQIDPNQIETIDVFKGPSATAMFGSDAANGVIVITTKKGKDGPTQWSVAMNTGLSYAPGKYPESLFVYGSYQGLFDFLLNGVTYSGILLSGGTIDSIRKYQALDDPQYTPFAYGQERGVSTSVSGGSQKLQYRMTVGGNNDIGFLKMPRIIETRYRETYGKTQPGWMKRPDQYNTWNGGGTFTAYVSPKMRVSFNTNLVNSEQRHSALGTGIVSALMELPPDSLIGSRVDRFYERNINTTLTSTNVADMNWEVRPSIPLTITAGVSTQNRSDESLLPRGILNDIGGISAPDSSGKYAIGRSTAIGRTLLARIDRIPVGFRQFTIGVGTNLEWETVSQFRASATSLPQGVEAPNIGLSAGQVTSARTIFGWYVQPQFNFNSRFFIIPGFRIDNTSLSGSNAKFMRLPKMQLSWLVSDEPLFPLKNLFSELRVRTSFGISGTQPDATSRLRLLALDSLASTPDLYRYGATLSTLGNTRLRPEASEELEGGFEAGFWDGRLGLDVTGYRKTRTDAIVNAPLAASVAVASSPTNFRNIGVIRNSGTEITLSARILESPRLGWTNQWSFSHNTNRVVRLNAGQEPITLLNSGAAGSSQVRIVAGYPLFGRWAPTLVGFADANGDGNITEEEIILSDSSVYLGSQDPTMEASYSSTISLLQGRLSINALFHYSGGGIQTNTARGDGLLRAVDSTQSMTQQARSLARELTGSSQKVSTLRFQTFSINYQLPNTIAQRFRGRTMIVSIQGSNLGLKTNYSGKDPNVNGDVTGNNTEDMGMLAQPRKWSLRITLNN